jgi:hypothetical protein
LEADPAEGRQFLLGHPHEVTATPQPAPDGDVHLIRHVELSLSDELARW